MGRSKFKYEGPVKSFNNVLTTKWEGFTWAKTDGQALNNLAYQYKIQHGFTPNYKLYLRSDCLTEVSAIDDVDDYDYIIPESWRRVLNEGV